MRIKEISFQEFDEFASNHELSSYHQSSSYALFMAENDYDYDYIAYVDNHENIVAASLILFKKLGLFNRYGYAPKGFLIDYTNKELLINFTSALKEHYLKEGISFIKINPEIAIGEINPSDEYKVIYNQNTDIINVLESLNYKKLKRNLYFESRIPKFNAILPLKSFNVKNISKQTRNKIYNSYNKGLQIEMGGRDSIDIIYDFFKNKNDKDILYYKKFYNVFEKNNAIDIFLVKVNFQDYLINAKILYEKELEKNNNLNANIQIDTSPTMINKKMESDKVLLRYKDMMTEASSGATSFDKDLYVAGAMVVKKNNRVTIFTSGFDKKYDHFNANYFLHYQIIEYYKFSHDFLDLNGLSGDFSLENKYYGLNKFKMGFKPRTYEFIGEFDLIINESIYQNLLRKNILYKELNKKDNEIE